MDCELARGGWERCEDGVYSIAEEGSCGYSRAVKADGKWYYSDGTGWQEEMLNPRGITSIKPIDTLKVLKRTVKYKNTYPLTEFFPKHEEK